MAGTVDRKSLKAEGPLEVVRVPVHSLPPDVVYIIMELLKQYRNTIRACSLSIRTFRAVAQSFLGRHISANNLNRVKGFLGILKESGFQHIRSLSLGITGEQRILEKYWKDYLAILKIFAARRSLVRLWLWEVPFFFLQPPQKDTFKRVVLALSSSVNDLRLYGCHFSCYDEMVSFVRAFQYCNKLHIEDCVMGGEAAPVNPLADLPQHKLSIVELNITTSLKNALLIEPSGLIEDAGLDVSSLSKLFCGVQSAKGNHRILSATSESPISEMWFSASCPEGFQAFVTLASPRWRLKSLTIGPMSHEADSAFWEAALKDFPRLPHLSAVRIIYNYRTHKSFNTSCWDHFNSILSNRHIIPRLACVDIFPTIRSEKLGYGKKKMVYNALSSLKWLDSSLSYLGVPGDLRCYY